MYIFIRYGGGRKGKHECWRQSPVTANLRTNIMDLRGFDSSRILILRGGILMSIGDFPESLSRANLAGIILEGRLGVWLDASAHQPL